MMEFDCLIKLLKEKGLIEINPKMLADWEKRFGLLEIRAKYPEVIDKIEEAINEDKTIVRRLFSQHTYIRLFKKEDILNVLDQETFGKDSVYAYIEGDDITENHPIAEWINTLEDYEYVRYFKKHSKTDLFRVKNLTIEKVKKEKAEKEKEEALAFLDSLP